MRYKLLGKSGLRVSELCLGTMTFGLDFKWGTPKDEGRKIFQAFVEAGGNFIDSANTYARSEEFLGEFASGQRERLVIASKYTGAAAGKDVNGAGTHRKNLVQSVEASLKRLKTDYIDLLWIHAWDFKTPAEEVMRALDDLVRQGKILYTGVSNAPAWVVARCNTLADLRGMTPFIALQVEYSLIEREAERELVPMAREMDIGVTAWAPLAAGWLTGKYSEQARREPEQGEEAGPNRLDDEFASRFVQRSPRNIDIAAEVVSIAEEMGCAPSQVALSWVRKKGVIPIFGARRVEQAEENLRCLGTDLSGDHMARLDKASRIALGYPHDFLTRVKPFVFGGTYDLIDDHRRRASL